uniref:BACK domain-containing protein n=1 Tax=Panagrellus redivivus TaxID=6233 RepID=A0A7E4VTY8_PANRE
MAPSDAPGDGGNFVRFRAADEGRHLSRVGSFLRNARRRGDPTYMDFGLRTSEGKIVMLNTIVGAVHSEAVREFLSNSVRRNPSNGVVMHLPKFTYATVVKVVDYMFNAHTDLNVDLVHEYLEVTAYLGVDSLHQQLERKLAADAEHKPAYRVDYLNMATDPRYKLSHETLDRLVLLLAQHHDALSTSDIYRLSAQSMIALVSTNAVNFHEKVDIINLALLWLRSDEDHMRFTPDVLSAIYIQRLTNVELEAFISYLQTQLIRKQTRHLVHVYSDMGHRIIVSNDPKKFVANSGVVVPTVEDPGFPSLDVTQSKRNETSTIEVNTNYGRFDLDDQDLHEIQALPDFERREQVRLRTPRNYENERRNRGSHEEDFRGALGKPQKRAGFGRFDPQASDLNVSRGSDASLSSRGGRREAPREFTAKPTNFRIFSNNRKENSTDEDITSEPKGRPVFAPKQSYKPFLSANEQSQQSSRREPYRPPAVRSASGLSTLAGNSSTDYDERGAGVPAVRSNSRLSSLVGSTTVEAERGLVTSPARHSSRSTLDSEDYRGPNLPAYYNPGNRDLKYSPSTISELQRVPDVFNRSASNRDFVEANNNDIKNFQAKSPRSNATSPSQLSPLVGGRSTLSAVPSKAPLTDANNNNTSLLGRDLRSPSEINEIKAYPSFTNVGKRPSGRERETFVTPSARYAAKKQETRLEAQSPSLQNSPQLPDPSPASIRSTSLAPYGNNNSTYMYTADSPSSTRPNNNKKPTMANGTRPFFAPGKQNYNAESPSQIREINNLNDPAPKSDSSIRSVALGQNANKPSLKGNSKYAYDKPS